MHNYSQYSSWNYLTLFSLIPLFSLFGCSDKYTNNNFAASSEAGSGNPTQESNTNIFPTPVNGDNGNPNIQPAPSSETPFPVIVDAGVKITFAQISKPNLDFLWVIDTSGSMAKAQKQLADNFKDFAKTLVELGNIDANLAVTSMDVCDDGKTFCPDGIKANADQPLKGKLVGNTVLNSADPNFINNFSSLAQVGVNGSTYEHGFSAAKIAINNAYNDKKLFRENAKINIVFVTDEEEQAFEFSNQGIVFQNRNKDGIPITPGILQPTDASKFYDYNNGKIGDIKTFPNVFVSEITKNITEKYKSTISFHAITTIRDETAWNSTERHFGILKAQNPDCGKNAYVLSDGKTTMPNLESGTAYIQAALLTGGVIANLCDLNWSNSLIEIAKNAVQLQRIFPLGTEKKPQIDSIKVYVQNQLIPTNQYSYDYKDNAIIFKADFVPQFNAKITVTYNEVF